MPEFFLELFSEEIPARMQMHGAVSLGDLCAKCLGSLDYADEKIFYGPRRIAVRATIASETASSIFEARGPRDTAPEAALAGFLGKYAAKREDVVLADGYYLLRREIPAAPAATILADVLPDALAKFSWPKAMRWGQGGEFSWVRPLRRIVCLLDGAIIPIRLGPITAGNETEGHRNIMPSALFVSSCADWQEKLRAHHVIADPKERRDKIVRGITEQAAVHGLTVAMDNSLTDEVAGLVEWPVALSGRIDEHFMDLPPEVRELSMKINQRYFALRNASGNPAPYFAFVANLEAPDGGAAIIAGNERVLRARLSDARHFWDIDLKTPLNELLPKLEKITFHAKIGSQRQRADRIAGLARQIAENLGATGHQAEQAEWAGRLCKADLVTGMVGEFPELQGVMGGYYAEKNPHGWDGALVGPAIRTHYQPKGPSDDVPAGTIAVSVALADKLDTLREFFAAGERPSGSGDPYALRRAALGVIRIVLENNLRLSLNDFLDEDNDLFNFVIERLRVKLRGEGKRFDVLDAVFAVNAEGDLVRLMKRVEALGGMLATEDGQNLLSAYRRAANILKIEDAKDGPHNAAGLSQNFETSEEAALFEKIGSVQEVTLRYFRAEDDAAAMRNFAALRPVTDNFFQRVTVNDKNPDLRRNRLALLARLRDTMHQIADFSKIEG